MFGKNLCGIAVLAAVSASAAPFFFSTGSPDGRIGMASRPSSPGKIEIEAADDFVVPVISGTWSTVVTSVTFTGLLVNADIANVDQLFIKIHPVFPNNSDVNRTSGPPNFSTDQVPTRVNSPSDINHTRYFAVSFTAAVVQASLTAANSISGSINRVSDTQTGGEGAVTGSEVQFNVTFVDPLVLAPDHYFFVPQVGLNNSGDFYWLSASRPIVPPGTPFSPDLQAWIRDENLSPDWFRVGTDVVGGNPAATFNGSFSLTGFTIPEPSTVALVAVGVIGMVAAVRRRGS